MALLIWFVYGFASLLALLLSLAFVSRLVFLVARFRLHYAGVAAAVQCEYCEADRDEKDVYAGHVPGCPAYDQVPLPRTGGTVHLPRDKARSGSAIIFLPGKGRVFNLFPLQKKTKDSSFMKSGSIDVVGVDYCAYGVGFERNVQESRLPRLLYEMRLHEMTDTLIEALEITSGIYEKVLVVANSTAAVAVLELLTESGEALKSWLPAMSSVKGFWLTNPVVAWKEGHFVNSIVESRLPTWFFTFLDRGLGLGPLLLQSDTSKDWFYKDKNGFKACFAMPGRTCGVMVGVPRYQQAANPMRLLHVSEIVSVRREWAKGKKRQCGLGASRMGTRMPVYFSLNYGADEWHCGANEAKKLLCGWGATEMGQLGTHEEFHFESETQWESAFAVLKRLASIAFDDIQES